MVARVYLRQESSYLNCLHVYIQPPTYYCSHDILMKVHPSGFFMAMFVVESKSFNASHFEVIRRRPFLFHCLRFSAIWREVKFGILLDVSLEILNCDALRFCIFLLAKRTA